MWNDKGWLGMIPEKCLILAGEAKKRDDLERKLSDVKMYFSLVEMCCFPSFSLPLSPKRNWAEYKIRLFHFQSIRQDCMKGEEISLYTNINPWWENGSYFAIFKPWTMLAEGIEGDIQASLQNQTWVSRYEISVHLTPWHELFLQMCACCDGMWRVRPALQKGNWGRLLSIILSLGAVDVPSTAFAPWTRYSIPKKALGCSQPFPFSKKKCLAQIWEISLEVNCGNRICLV